MLQSNKYEHHAYLWCQKKLGEGERGMGMGMGGAWCLYPLPGITPNINKIIVCNTYLMSQHTILGDISQAHVSISRIEDK